MIVLTGGTGFVGQRVARRLTSEGRGVRILSRQPRPSGFPVAVEWAAGDLTFPSSLTAALTGTDTVIHLAAALAGGGGSAFELRAVNVGGTEALARMARAVGVRRFIHLSSAGVYGDGVGTAPHRESDRPAPTTAYERSKLEAERVLQAALDGSQVRWLILRPPGLYGPDRPATAAFFREVAHRRVWLHGPTRVWVHPTHVVDLVEAIVRAVHRDDLHGDVVNVGGARPLEFRELIALTGARVGRTPLQLSAPGWSGRIAAAAAGACRLVGAPSAALDRLARPRVNRTVDIEKVRRLLGLEPVALEWGLDQTAAELRAMGLLAQAPQMIAPVGLRA